MREETWFFILVIALGLTIVWRSKIVWLQPHHRMLMSIYWALAWLLMWAVATSSQS